MRSTGPPVRAGPLRRDHRTQPGTRRRVALQQDQGGEQPGVRELSRDGKSISAIARIFDVHPATIYRVIEE